VSTRQRKTAVLSNSEQVALIKQPNQKAPTGLRNLCILMLMLKAGLRVGEVITLAVEDIDWEECKVYLAESGAAKERTLWLDDELLGLLKAWRKIRPSESRYFLCTLKGRPLNDRYLREMVKRLGRKAGINKDVYPHLLRSTFAVNLIQETNDIRLTQNALGHRDASTTQLYVKHMFSEHSMTYYDILGYRRSGIPAKKNAAEKPRPKLLAASINDNTRSRNNYNNRPERKREEEVESEEIGPNRSREQQNIQIKPLGRPDETEMQYEFDFTGKRIEKNSHAEPEPGLSSGPTEERTVQGNPIPPIKCSKCAYILRYDQDCPQCGTAFASILKHWRGNV